MDKIKTPVLKLSWIFNIIITNTYLKIFQSSMAENEEIIDSASAEEVEDVVDSEEDEATDEDIPEPLVQPRKPTNHWSNV